jgi:hypothetical protein
MPVKGLVRKTLLFVKNCPGTRIRDAANAVHEPPRGSGEIEPQISPDCVSSDVFRPEAEEQQYRGHGQPTSAYRIRRYHMVARTSDWRSAVLYTSPLGKAT